ncbi:MAG: type IV secretion system DNA-binding domain-containing protein, partial [Alphaproteobacteria bacterium]|nr:type IV secretion system DNA-binding domain-containing protein [Alphaproteobacteria bacterium]
MEETRALVSQLRARPNPHTPREIGARVYRFFEPYAPDALVAPLAQALDEIIRGETYMFEFPEGRPERMTLKEFADYRNFLRHKQYFLDNHEQIAQLLHECLVRIFCGIAEALPQTEDPSPFTIPLINALPDPGTMITQLYQTLLNDEYYDRLILRALTERLYVNLCDASGIVPYAETKKPAKHAMESTLPLEEMNDQYLSGTPFHALFKTPVPLKFTYADRYNHMHLVGGTGAGKTTLLKNLILSDLQAETPPALVIIDSQGDLIRELARLRLFGGPLADRFVLITPKDIEHPPALNVFDVNRSRLGTYDQLTREQVIAGVIQTFDYLFSGLLGADLTAKQGVFFKYVARLMLSIRDTMGRNATILDMLELMDNPAPYAAAIRSL